MIAEPDGAQVSAKTGRKQGSARASWLRAWSPTLLWMALVEVGTSVPHLPEVWPAPNVDKVEHCLAYGVMGLLIWRSLSLRHAGAGLYRCAVAAVALAAAYGAADELHQRFIPGRSCDWRDWVADLTGASLLVAAVSLVYAIRSSRR